MDGLAPDQVRTLLRWFKDGPPGAIPIELSGRSIGLLQAVTWEDAGDVSALERLGRWHESAFSWFPEPFPVTADSARQWLVEQVLPNADRILFWVRDVRGEFLGHLGLSRFDYDLQTVTIADILCSRPTADPLLTAAVVTLTSWVREALFMQARPADHHRRLAA